MGAGVLCWWWVEGRGLGGGSELGFSEGAGGGQMIPLRLSV